MLRVFAQVPCLSQSYEMQIGENKPMSIVLNEMLAAISQTEHITVEDQPDAFLVLHKERKSILNAYQSAVQAGVRDGDTLIII